MTSPSELPLDGTIRCLNTVACVGLMRRCPFKEGGPAVRLIPDQGDEPTFISSQVHERNPTSDKRKKSKVQRQPSKHPSPCLPIYWARSWGDALCLVRGA